MAGTTISGAHTVGITLTSTSSNPVLVTGTITVPSGDALYGKPGAANTWTINNSGEIISEGATGVFLGSYGATVAGGMLTNSKYIYGANYGVYINGPGLVTNLSGGTIGAGDGGSVRFETGKGTFVNYGIVLGGSDVTVVEEKAGGTVTNLSTGTISGGAAGVRLDALGTITDAGSILTPGGKAIYFASSAGASRLIIDPGAVITGFIYNGAIGSGTVIELASGASAGKLVGFDGATITNFATLQFDTGAKWTVVGSNASRVSSGTTVGIGINAPVITGFGANDTIDLTGFSFAGATVASFGSNALTLTNSAAQHATLHVQGAFTSGDFHLSSYNSGTGTSIVVCFAAGTCIATPEGAVKVEDLAVGDMVRAHFAGSAPIKWLGRRQVDCTRHPDPKQVWPVRVVAGGFGPGQPRRDLFLSPNHAVYVDDVLIPVRRLINGSSIAQVPVGEVTYYHIELEDHDVLFAEGMPTESYLDVGDRSNFANGDAPMRLFPDFASHPLDIGKPWEALGCAPLILHGLQLEAVRRRVNNLANDLAHAVAV